MMSVSELMRRHNIERIVFVPESDLLSSHSFHAWPFGAFNSDLHMGTGPTVEEAIMDAARKLERIAA